MVYMFLAEGFEEVEALCPLDILRRAGVKVKTVGVGSKNICGAHNICVATDITIDEFCDNEPEMIILPGGMPGTLNLDGCATVHCTIDSAVKCNAYIAAICAAPSILGKRDLLVGKEAICYPGFESTLNGAKISEKRVVTDGKIITAAGMGVALDFALVLVKLLCGTDKAEEIKKSILAD